MFEQKSVLLLLGLMIISPIKGLPLVEPSNNLSLAETVDFGRVVYDQRQEGKYNIHVSIKDVAIIDMDQNQVEEDDIYDDGEYYYENGEPLIINPTTNTPIVSNSTTPKIILATLKTTTTLNIEDYPSLTTIINETIQQNLQKKQQKTQLLQQNVENKSKINDGLHKKELRTEISPQAPESPIYRFEVSQRKQNNLQKLQRNPLQFETKQVLMSLKQQPLHQHVRYPTPIHQLTHNYHHHHQLRRGDTSASAILRKFFNMLFTLPSRDRK